MSSYLVILCASLVCITFFKGCYAAREDDLLLQKTMDESVKDLFEETLESEGRFLFGRGSALNTSVSFTMPLFSFTLPVTKEDDYAGGIDGPTYGVLGFIALYIVGGIGMAVYSIYKVTYFGHLRSFDEGEKYFDNRILNLVFDSFSGLPEAIDIESCAKLSICEAHSQPEKYGLLAWPIRFLVPAKTKMNDNDTSTYEDAATYGYEKRGKCYFEYPCLVQPLDFVIYLKDYLLNTWLT